MRIEQSSLVGRRGVLGLVLQASAAFSLILGATKSSPGQDAQSRPISQAILNRDLAAVRQLVEGGEDVNQRLFNRETPAIMAATAECWEIVAYLLQAGADAALENRLGFTVATFATTSLVAPDQAEGRALGEVKRILTARGLM